jgi:hypothetical protein
MSYHHIIIIIIIFLGLGFTNEWEYVIFGLLSLAYLEQHDDLQFHHFPANGIISFFFMAE